MLVILTSIVEQRIAMTRENTPTSIVFPLNNVTVSLVKRATSRGRFYDYLQSRVLIQSQTLWYEGFAALSQTE